MATWYTDVATNQQQYLNFPGQTGLGYLTSQPGTQNFNVLEGFVGSAWATYTWTGNEAANDVINIVKLEPGQLVGVDGRVRSGLTAPATTLTIAIGDNDLGLATNLPIPNAAAFVSASSAALPEPAQAPNWVSGATYAPGNVVIDPNSTPANMTYMAVVATSGATAPHSAATTVWMPCNQRYSSSIDIHAATGNVSFAGGTQFYGAALSMLPYSIVPNSVPLNATAAQIANSPYIVQRDCWLQALILTANTIVANTVSVFVIPVYNAN